ncbi:serine/threonine-protein kinase [Pyxidicoccus xibeiensis]|uniref:serine/threonine-protein kinase n=1 Tax=Pyxidicoccus xibeiensis TaxID=2906759 RepID=UPI0020A7A2D6|nr:serine/threonine-protein kinase [Pyxidicoccus xibeiensis]MCP3139893.1 serine/threonine-protein kinase [Pyxidicoccus xibeiensis]
MDCLSDDVVHALVRGQLPRPEADACSDHLTGCGRCTQAYVSASTLRLTRDLHTQVSWEAPVPPPPPSLPRGAQLGRYLVLERLGVGGMGEVYAAFDPRLDRRVALKLLRPPNQGDAEARARARERLLGEARAMARLSHPHVAQVFDVGDLEGRVFLAMELVEGLTLGAWLRAGPHPRSEVLRLFTQAGRGLSAAHAAGIIHRDFKPENVVLGPDGRARVVDFGVARIGEVAPLPEGAPRAEAPLAPPAWAGGGADEAVQGTPGFMAPEQYLPGGPVDARADQFAFAASLYLALCGRPAFQGRTPSDLYRAVRLGRVAPPPPEARLTYPVHRALLRALRPEPERRFASMDALLEALEPSPLTRRPLVVGAVMAGVLGVMLASGLPGYQEAHRAAACRREARVELDAAWGPGRAEAMERAFLGSGVPYARETLDSTRAALDAYGRAWAEQRVAVCTVGQAHDADAAVLALQGECLRARRQDLAALVDVLMRADTRVVEASRMAATGLPALASCMDTKALRSSARAEEGTRTSEPERAALAKARALAAAGRPSDGLAELLPLAPEAGALLVSARDAELAYVTGYLLVDTGREDEGRALLKRAAWAALGSHDDVLALDIVSHLALVLGSHLGETRQARDWFELGRTLLARRPGADAQATALFRAGGRIDFMAGRLQEAEGWMREALARAVRAHGEGSLQAAERRAELAYALAGQGRFEEAVAERQLAVAVLERTFGASHPRVGYVLRGLAFALNRQGKAEEALVSAQQALTLIEAAHTPRHAVVGAARNTVAEVLVELGRTDEARAMAERAVAATREAEGESHPGVAIPLTTLGLAQLQAGRAAEAERTLREALRLCEALPEDHPNRSDVLEALGEARRALGQGREAVAALEAALRLREAVVHQGPELATTRFHLARALHATGGTAERTRALALARQAAPELTGARVRGELAAWLARAAP